MLSEFFDAAVDKPELIAIGSVVLSVYGVVFLINESKRAAKSKARSEYLAKREAWKKQREGRHWSDSNRAAAIKAESEAYAENARRSAQKAAQASRHRNGYACNGRKF